MIVRNATVARRIATGLTLIASMSFVACGTTSRSTAPVSLRPIGTSLNPWPEDVQRKSELEKSGICLVRDHVVAYFPHESHTGDITMSDAEMQAVANLLDKGVCDAKSFIGAPDWSVGGDRRVYFYFADANFISHAPGGNTVFIPSWRMREHKAPWLHEAMHILIAVDGDWLSQPENVANDRMPLWLHEGLAEAIAAEVAMLNGFAHYSPLIDVPLEQLDEFASNRVRDCPNPQRLLAYVGSRGTLPDLFGEDRMKYAVAFYAASTSFVRFLARRDGGYQHLLAAVASFDRETETYERLSGTSLAALKHQWASDVGIDTTAENTSIVP